MKNKTANNVTIVAWVVGIALLCTLSAYAAFYLTVEMEAFKTEPHDEQVAFDEPVILTFPEHGANRGVRAEFSFDIKSDNHEKVRELLEKKEPLIRDFLMEEGYEIGYRDLQKREGREEYRSIAQEWLQDMIEKTELEAEVRSAYFSEFLST